MPPRKPDTSRLTRAIHPMPAFVKALLVGRGLMDAYRSRPAYQQNDYIGWIMRAKLDATRQKRVTQMLDELDAGNKYMNMNWSGRVRASGRVHGSPRRPKAGVNMAWKGKRGAG
ncbi:YdeI/OmpD-associated family protein [Pendulispora brunnea]|uniref:YdeI/OmpD-associated family protein n=1 Tax=Pendulispora brunnea TaxID=2905690 RepID=A0ABZ2KJ31_9BACT